MTTMVLRRAWTGPALFSYGFRPFFLFAALHAALMAALWVPWHLGLVSLPSAFPPTVWHSHEMLFGYGPAVVAGFLLTAVPNWTGRLPVVGWPLALLFAAWLAGRIGMAASAPLGAVPTAFLSLLFPVALCAVIAREIVAGRNWRNLKVLAGIGVLTAAQALFHVEFWRDGHATYANHLAVAATLALIMIVGGRIVPSFTTNWLKRENPGALPKPFNRFDRLAMILSFAALAAWVAAPALSGSSRIIAAVMLIVAGLLQAARLMRWVPWRTLREPLVTVLHVGYGFVPLGFLLAGWALMQADPLAATAATHAWTVGAIGVMTLAVMTRATRGHTGQSLEATLGTVAIYGLALVAALARIAASLWPEAMVGALGLAGIGWIGAFALFAILYGPLLAKPAGTR